MISRDCTVGGPDCAVADEGIFWGTDCGEQVFAEGEVSGRSGASCLVRVAAHLTHAEGCWLLCVAWNAFRNRLDGAHECRILGTLRCCEAAHYERSKCECSIQLWYASGGDFVLSSDKPRVGSRPPALQPTYSTLYPASDGGVGGVVGNVIVADGSHR